MPCGAPRLWSQGGKRCSSGTISALPTGESPITASSTRLPIASRQPARENRVRSSSAPKMPSRMMKLDGIAKKPKIFEA